MLRRRELAGFDFFNIVRQCSLHAIGVAFQVVLTNRAVLPGYRPSRSCHIRI